MPNIIYSGNPGALPCTFEYIPVSDTPVLLQLTGSVWTSGTNSMIGLKVEIAGKEVVTASIFSNGPTTHRAVNTGFAEHTFPIKIAAGNIEPVSITIDKLNGQTIFDVNDSVTLIAL